MKEYEDLFVKETEETTKETENGEKLIYKVVLGTSGNDDGTKITIKSDSPIDLAQGEKDLKVTISSNQKKLTEIPDLNKDKKKK